MKSSTVFELLKLESGGNDLAIRLNGDGVGLIDISCEVGSNGAARPEGRVEIAGVVCAWLTTAAAIVIIITKNVCITLIAVYPSHWLKQCVACGEKYV